MELTISPVLSKFLRMKATLKLNPPPPQKKREDVLDMVSIALTENQLKDQRTCNISTEVTKHKSRLISIDIHKVMNEDQLI